MSMLHVYNMIYYYYVVSIIGIPSKSRYIESRTKKISTDEKSLKIKTINLNQRKNVLFLLFIFGLSLRAVVHRHGVATRSHARYIPQ